MKHIFIKENIEIYSQIFGSTNLNNICFLINIAVFYLQIFYFKFVLRRHIVFVNFLLLHGEYTKEIKYILRLNSK